MPLSRSWAATKLTARTEAILSEGGLDDAAKKKRDTTRASPRRTRCKLQLETNCNLSQNG